MRRLSKPVRKIIEGIVKIIISFFIGAEPFDILWFYYVTFRNLPEDVVNIVGAPLQPMLMHFVLLASALILFVFGAWDICTGVKLIRRGKKDKKKVAQENGGSDVEE